MLKNLKADLRGYVYFTVNGEPYGKYEEAERRRVELCEADDVSVFFTGFHILKGEICFFAKYLPYSLDWRSGMTLYADINHSLSAGGFFAEISDDQGRQIEILPDISRIAETRDELTALVRSEYPDIEIRNY